MQNFFLSDIPRFHFIVWASATILYLAFSALLFYFFYIKSHSKKSNIPPVIEESKQIFTVDKNTRQPDFKIAKGFPVHENKTIKNEATIEKIPFVNETVKFSFVSGRKEKFFVVGASIIGKDHVENSKPCQDANAYKDIGEGWSISVISDGAGSSDISQVGSQFVCKSTVEVFQKLIELNLWKKNRTLPSQTEWDEAAFQTLKFIRSQLKHMCETKNLEFKMMKCTVIVLINSPFGILITHIGDGRAGIKKSSGEWVSIIMPHKGKEANMTAFITDEWENSNIILSDVKVPESKVIKELPTAFTLLTDGCENSSFLLHTLNTETNKYFDRNIPYDNFFNPLVIKINEFVKHNKSDAEILSLWENFLIGGVRKLETETDDKTMILGTKISFS